MKKSYFVLLVFLALISQKGSAQTISWSTFSNLTTHLNPIRVAENSSFNAAILADTGLAKTWDASGLTPNGSVPSLIMGYYPPSRSLYGSNFPTANYVRLDTNLLTQLEHEFDFISQDSFSIVGTYKSSGEHEVYTDPMQKLIFPMSFDQTVSDNYAKTNYSDATTISSYQTGTNTIKFCGHGTLNLPQQPFENVAMVTMIRTNNLGPNSLDVSWYSLDLGIILMNYHSNNGSVTVGYNTIVTQPSIGTHEWKEASREISLMNNGSSQPEIVNNAKREQTFFIYEINGRMIESLTIEAGERMQVLSEKTAGVYFLRTESGQFVKILRD